MRKVLTHRYDTIDLDRVIAALDPTTTRYQRFGAWAAERIANPAKVQPSQAVR